MESEDRAAQAAIADKIASFTSSFPTISTIQNQNQCGDQREK